VIAQALLQTLAAALRTAKIPFMLTGSVAAAYHGAGRATLNLDVVIDPNPEQLEALVRAIDASGHYVSIDAAREAMTNHSMFNVVDPDSGWKADLIVRKPRQFSETDLARRQPIDFFGVEIDVATLEDVVLSKLEWAKLGGSARQLDDVRTLLRVRGDEFDTAYAMPWIAALGIRDQWDAVNTP
jgi:hypothetical protein